MNKPPPARWSALVVEPDRARSAMMIDLLRDLGCADVIVARDGQAARAQLEVHAPRIILVSARMPGEDGLAFTRAYRRDPAMRSNELATVVVFPGLSQSDLTAALNAGADAVLTFPMSRNQLGGMLKLLDTQKRPFVRAASYVGPCRRRGLVGGDTRRRLEDFGASTELAEMMLALERLYVFAELGRVTPEHQRDTAAILAAYLRAARPDRQVDDAALLAQCAALVKQYVDHAPAMKSFEHAFAPLRKLLTNIMLSDAKRAA